MLYYRMGQGGTNRRTSLDLDKSVRGSNHDSSKPGQVRLWLDESGLNCHPLMYRKYEIKR